MAVSWPLTSTVLRSPVPTATSADARPGTVLPRAVERARALALAPLTALVAMALGLALLFVVPFVGLPFVALVVLPAVIYHLQAERRPRYGARRR